MNSNLAPTYKKMFGDYWVLWFAISNSYSVVSLEFEGLLDIFLSSNNYNTFSSALPIELSAAEKKDISESLLNYLESCNQPYVLPDQDTIALDTASRQISKLYAFEDKTIQIHYSSESVLKTIHPAIANYCKALSDINDVTFDIHLYNDQLCLFKNETLITAVPKGDYHLVQGKFIMHLLCELHDIEEQDWIGTLHGSTITDGESSILFIGKSGKGKSTLCALLAAHGFHLLADDVSPLHSKNQHLYYNPSSISLKEGAFNLLKPLVPNFDELPIVEFNKIKGQLKYLPTTKPEKDHYPCQAIVLVNYTPDSETILEDISVQFILETLIEDSWLSPNPKHAEQFINWLHTLPLLQLTYSTTPNVLREISTLFKQFNCRQ
ncbi:hypothetical protein [Winogradskyella sediminis]|uniref:hypothetical protein n=1 Tax=Winogradskyella sediminis TaxID=1382466 RepID=UPI003AA7D70B